MRALSILVLVALLLSGCAGDEPEAGGASPTRTDGTQVDALAEPAAWEVGDWWRYTTDGPDGSAEVTLIATAEDATTYTMDTTGRSMAAFDAETDVSYVGPIGKDDLSGRQAGAPIRYFQFPLQADATWTTTWDDQSHTIVVERTDGSVATLRADRDGTPRIRYTYDAAAGFFASLEFLDEDGSVGYSMRLAQHGANYTGTYLRANVEEVLNAGSSGPGPEAADFMVPAGTQELVVRWEVNCTQSAAGAWRIDLAPAAPDQAAEQHFETSGQCPSESQDEGLVELPYPGPWGYAGSWVGQAGGAFGHHVRALARSFQETTFP